MKKIILGFVLAMGIAAGANAQVKGNAIGLRLGGSYNGYYGTEISFQHAMGSANRLELDLGLSNWGTGLSGIYQWAWNIDGGFNWYAGVGGNVGIWDSGYKGYSGVNLGVAGQIGVEYNFSVPLQLSLDYRPIIPIVNGHGYSDGIALGIRYRF